MDYTKICKRNTCFGFIIWYTADMHFQIPYDVKLYQSPHYGTKPRVASTGHIDWEFDTEQMALLDNEKGNPKRKYTKWFLDSITDYLGRYMKERLVRKRKGQG